MRARKTVRLADALGQILNRPAWKKGLQEAAIRHQWEEIVGPDFAEHSRPVKLNGGRLEVECDHDVWRAQLHYLKPEILKKIAEIRGEGAVREIYLK